MSQMLPQTKLRALDRATAVRYLRHRSARSSNRRPTVPDDVSARSPDLRSLERLFPTENGITVFDAETQETSYGICFVGGFPYIFDTHLKAGRYVATIELVTELVDPVRIPPARVRAFGGAARGLGLLPIPYTGCFFKGNLHVYSFSGPVRGFDLAATGPTVAACEANLVRRVTRLWPRIPGELERAQHELIAGRRKVRHVADLEVLRDRWDDREKRRGG